MTGIGLFQFLTLRRIYTLIFIIHKVQVLWGAQPFIFTDDAGIQ